MRNLEEQYNALPEEIRHICCAMDCKMRINQMNIDKGRIIRAYRKTCTEIDNHMKICEEVVAKFENEAGQ